MLMHDAGGGGDDEVDRWVFGAGGCSAAVFAQYLGVNMSSLSMTAFTVERYVAICHPFTARVADSAGRARRVTLTLWIVGIASVSRSLFRVVAAAFFSSASYQGWFGSRVVSVLDSGPDGPGSNRSRDAVG